MRGKVLQKSTLYYGRGRTGDHNSVGHDMVVFHVSALLRKENKFMLAQQLPHEICGETPTLVDFGLNVWNISHFFLVLHLVFPSIPAMSLSTSS